MANSTYILWFKLWIIIFSNSKPMTCWHVKVLQWKMRKASEDELDQPFILSCQPLSFFRLPCHASPPLPFSCFSFHFFSQLGKGIPLFILSTFLSHTLSFRVRWYLQKQAIRPGHLSLFLFLSFPNLMYSWPSNHLPQPCIWIANVNHVNVSYSL